MGGEMVWAAIYLPAALAEIAGCFSFWAVMRLGYSALWLAPGLACLILFAWLLSFSPAENSGRAYALYGGIYIVCSLIWGWCVEGHMPDKWDMIGAMTCLVGASIILLGPRGG